MKIKKIVFSSIVLGMISLAGCSAATSDGGHSDVVKNDEKSVAEKVFEIEKTAKNDAINVIVKECIPVAKMALKNPDSFEFIGAYANVNYDYENLHERVQKDYKLEGNYVFGNSFKDDDLVKYLETYDYTDDNKKGVKVYVSFSGSNQLGQSSTFYMVASFGENAGTYYTNYVEFNKSIIKGGKVEDYMLSDKCESSYLDAASFMREHADNDKIESIKSFSDYFSDTAIAKFIVDNAWGEMKVRKDDNVGYYFDGIDFEFKIEKSDIY